MGEGGRGAGQVTSELTGEVTGGRSPILDVLSLQELGPDSFSATTPPEGGPPRLFGGQVASQALRAATLTVAPERPPHSLHAYFVRPGRPGSPLTLRVERTRDGRSFTTRTVTASQGGRPILILAASFHGDEEGDDWHLPAPTGVPRPDDLPEPEPALRQFTLISPFDVRPVRGREAHEPALVHPFWIRTRDRLPDDPLLHACVLTYISDLAVVGGAFAPGVDRTHRTGASLDHAVWFHRPARADGWLLFSVDPASNHGGRGLARGTLHTASGVLVASMAQEALLRSTSGSSSA